MTNLPKHKHFITSKNWDDYLDHTIQHHDVYKDIHKQVIHEKPNNNSKENQLTINSDWHDVKNLIKR